MWGTKQVGNIYLPNILSVLGRGRSTNRELDSPMRNQPSHQGKSVVECDARVLPPFVKGTLTLLRLAIPV